MPAAGLVTPSQAAVLAAFSSDELEGGARQAADTVARAAGPADEDGHELIVSHSNLINWFVSRACGLTEWHCGMYHFHCGITVLNSRPGRPDWLVSYNDIGHLPPELRGSELHITV